MRSYINRPSVFGLELGLILAVFLMGPCHSFAQESSADKSAYTFFDSQYGLDPEIYKGRKYINLDNYQSGTPFFSSEKNHSISFYPGKILLDKKLYSNVLLSYDVYNQEVLIQSRSLSGVSNDIILPNTLIDEFWIGEQHFAKNPYKEIDALYVEVIENIVTEVVCYFSYNKEYRLQETSGKGEMGFGELRTRKYLFVNHTVYGFKGKKSFLKCLTDQNREESINFIKSNPLKFKDGDSVYFNSLLKSLSGKKTGDA